MQFLTLSLPPFVIPAPAAADSSFQSERRAADHANAARELAAQQAARAHLTQLEQVRLVLGVGRAAPWGYLQWEYVVIAGLFRFRVEETQAPEANSITF
jgi:hypothetical protein